MNDRSVEITQVRRKSGALCPTVGAEGEHGGGVWPTLQVETSPHAKIRAGGWWWWCSWKTLGEPVILAGRDE